MRFSFDLINPVAELADVVVLVISLALGRVKEEVVEVGENFRDLSVRVALAFAVTHRRAQNNHIGEAMLLNEAVKFVCEFSH